MTYDEGMNLAKALQKEGSTPEAIAKRLNQEGVLSKAGGKYSANGLSRALGAMATKRAPAIKLAGKAAKTKKAPAIKLAGKGAEPMLNFAIETLKKRALPARKRAEMAMMILKQV